MKENERALLKRPQWLNKKISFQSCEELTRLFKDSKLNTVCQQARCPNIGECFSKKVATFLILGNICTRNCAFCAVKKGSPGPVDSEEPQRVAEAVKLLDLKYVVITSVTRDDLEDGGAGIFAQTIRALKDLDARLQVEVLVPDFQAELAAIETVIASGPQVFAHNLETVPRLYSAARQKADYQRSLKVLAQAKKIGQNVHTKSGLMLGLGEKEDEVLAVLRDLRDVGCDFLSLGQYLAPTKDHLAVKEFIHPDKFRDYKEQARGLGFLHTESAPYVRSSYIASEYFSK